MSFPMHVSQRLHETFHAVKHVTATTTSRNAEAQRSRSSGKISSTKMSDVQSERGVFPVSLEGFSFGTPSEQSVEGGRYGWLKCSCRVLDTLVQGGERELGLNYVV